MKKVLALLALVAMVGFVSCKEKEDPVDPTQTATITANDVTVEEGATAQIGATTNSSAAITYASDNTAVATVSAAGEVTGVKAGTANVTLKVAAVEGKFTAAEKTIKVTVNAKPEEPQPAGLTIDGSFDDWAALKDGTFTKYSVNPDATDPALKTARIYANADYIYVYFEWDTDMVDHVPDYGIEDQDPPAEFVPFHCYINTDGDETTGGYGDQFTDACTDVLLEGFLYDGGEQGGEMGSYSPDGFAWAGDPNASGWAWEGLGAIECEGAGVEGKYELCISRAALAGVGFPVADVFSIGFDIQQSWDSVGILPLEAPSEENASGHVASLKVTTQK